MAPELLEPERAPSSWGRQISYARPGFGPQTLALSAVVCSPPRLLDDSESLVDFLPGDPLVRSLNVRVPQHVVSVEAVAMSIVERTSGSFPMI